MTKLFLAVSVLAFGAIVVSSQPHAALRSGGTNMPQVSGSGPNQPCKLCASHRSPYQSGSVSLNPQPLPPVITNDRMLRR
jgi:hypothetical protein